MEVQKRGLLPFKFLDRPKRPTTEKSGLGNGSVTSLRLAEVMNTFRASMIDRAERAREEILYRSQRKA